MDLQNTLLLLAQDFNQTEYGMGWALTLGLIFLGLLAVSIPRPRKKLPKDLLALEEAKAKRGKRNKASKKRKKKR